MRPRSRVAEDRFCRPSAVPRSSSGKLALGGSDFLVEVAAIDGIEIARERARPGGDRLIVASETGKRVTVVILHDGIGHQLIGGALQMLRREIEFPALEIRP